MWDKLALILLVIGGVNWGLVGIFEFDLVAWLFGGATSALSRIVYILLPKKPAADNIDVDENGKIIGLF